MMRRLNALSVSSARRATGSAWTTKTRYGVRGIGDDAVADFIKLDDYGVLFGVDGAPS